MSHLLFAGHLVATFAMTGIIWFVQIIQYPLMDRVPPATFTDYHQTYTQRIGLIVGPLMLLELVTAILLLFHVVAGPNPLWWIGLGLIAVNWLSTALLQVPCHHRLSRGYDPKVHHRLVATNWIRTCAWTARSILLVVVLAGSWTG